MTNPAFHRYIGIDYSGAETPDSSYPSLWSKSHPREGRTSDQHDA